MRTQRHFGPTLSRAVATGMPPVAFAKKVSVATRAETDVTLWTLLGLAVDLLFKQYCRRGLATVVPCASVKVCHIIQRGRKKWRYPGVALDFQLPEGMPALAMKLMRRAAEAVFSSGWRLFDGDLDLVRGRKHVGAVDGLADRISETKDVCCVEIKVRERKFATKSHEPLLSELNDTWTKSTIRRLPAPWSHGLLVLLCQVSPTRSYPMDGSIVYTWEKDDPTMAQKRSSAEHLGSSRESKRRRVTIAPWSDIEGVLEHGKIGRKQAVKLKSYLDAVGSKVNAGRALAQWKEHFGWGDHVWEDQGGARQDEARSGGKAAYFILLSCVKEAHRAKISGAL